MRPDSIKTWPHSDTTETPSKIRAFEISVADILTRLDPREIELGG